MRILDGHLPVNLYTSRQWLDYVYESEAIARGVHIIISLSSLPSRC